MTQPSRPREPRIVVAGVIRDPDGRFLVTQRPVGSHLGGLWEFPGGAVERGEEPVAALQRELAEELGVRAAVETPLTFAWHRDSQRDVVLLFYRARIEDGVPHGREGQAMRWVTATELVSLPTPPADAELIEALAEVAAGDLPRVKRESD